MNLTSEAPETFEESWFEPDLDLARDRYFAAKRRVGIRGLVVSGLVLLVCAGLFVVGGRLRAGSFWPLGILLIVVACIGGFIALVLWGSSGVEVAFHVRPRSRLSGGPRTQDSRKELLEVLRNNSPFFLYLRNFVNEESQATYTGDEFVPVDIHTPRWDSRLEDFALSAVPRDIPIFTIGFHGRLERAPRVHEVFVTDESWPLAFRCLARRAVAIITVVDQATDGVQRECETLTVLAAREHAPPIWMLLNTSMEDRVWTKSLSQVSRWVTRYVGVPSGEATPNFEGQLRRGELRP